MARVNGMRREAQHLLVQSARFTTENGQVVNLGDVFGLKVHQETVAMTGALSNPIDMEYFKSMVIVIPANWGGDRVLSFQVQMADGTWVNYFDQAGAEVTAAVKHSVAVDISDKLPSAGIIRIRCGTSVAPIDQNGRVFGIILKK